MLRHRVLHGLVLEWSVAAAIFVAFGVVAGVAFLLQAVSAVRLLEAVNYFEHWGLVRRGRRVRPEDSWDTRSWFTYYALIGLTRHADHHAAASRPYQALRLREEAPLLPFGYVGTIDLVMSRNDEFQAQASEELARRRLGPFAASGEDGVVEALPPDAAHVRLAEAQRAARSGTQRTGAIAARWTRLPARVRGPLVAAVIVLGTAVGVRVEGGASASLPGLVLLHAWILASFVLALGARRRVAERWGENLSWVLVFAALAASGLLSDRIF
jgi:hypothetical protein